MSEFFLNDINLNGYIKMHIITFILALGFKNVLYCPIIKCLMELERLFSG